MRARDSFREQAEACATLGSPMYAELLGRMADDIEAGGVTAAVLEGHEDDPGPSALALRLAGSLHRLVLEGEAGELAAFYPSVGGTWHLDRAWPVLERVLAERRDEVRAGLARAPQTNEVGRSAALMGGLLRIGEQYRLPVRLLEIGASGGLNLLADRFAYLRDGRVVQGPEGSPVRLEGCWDGSPLAPWPDLRVVERLGSDVAPVDVSTAEGRTVLTCYVWPDQSARLARLRSAFTVADRHRVHVRRQDARASVRELALRPGTTTVLWHSVMWQYLPQEDQDAISAHIEHLGSAASTTEPFAHLAAEPTRRAPGQPHEFLVTLRLWPGGERHVIGVMAPHGLPTTWE